MTDEKTLVRRLRRGDKQALLDLYEHTKHDLVTLSAALLADRSQAEDVVHDVFITFMARVRDFRLTGSLKGYLCTCVANRARNLNRAGARQAEPQRTTRIQPSPEHSAVKQEHLDQVERALATLPYEQREVLVRRVMTQDPFKQIAKAQGVSLNTVQGRFRYALQKVRDQLTHWDDKATP